MSDVYNIIPDDTPVLEGDPVQFTISYFAPPMLAPGERDITDALTQKTDFAVDSVDFGPGMNFPRAGGWATVKVRGKAVGDQTAGELRAEVQSQMAGYFWGLTNVATSPAQKLDVAATNTNNNSGPGVGTVISLVAVALIGIVLLLEFGPHHGS